MGDKFAEITEWLFIEGARQASIKLLSREEAIEISEYRMGTTMDAYADRIIRWSKRNHLTVIVVGGPERENEEGMCIAAPVSDNEYNEIRSGRRKTYECIPGEIMPEASANVIIEAVMMKPKVMTPSAPRTKSRALFNGLVSQLAQLSDVDGLATDYPLQFLTFAHTLLHRKLLLQERYKPLGIIGHGTTSDPIELFERAVIVGENPTDDFEFAVWRGIQALIRDRAKMNRKKNS